MILMNLLGIAMELSVIENDPKEVKKYLQNFVPINYYRVLDDAYLHQVRAVLLHSVSHAELYNPVYAGLINDLTVTSGKNYANVNTKIEGIVDNFSALARKTETLEVEAANANASITEIQEASAEQNKAQASVNQRLEASLDDIVVGGRNIMKNSDFSKGYRAWQEASITKHDHFIGTMHKISSTGIVGSLMGIYPLAEYQNMAMVEGTEYSISFYAYGSILMMDEIYLTSPSEAPIKLPNIVISTDLSDRRHITFKAPTGGGGLGLIFGATATSEDDWFSISRVKVELGNRPTDWTPAPEDVEGYIAEVQSSIDTFKGVQVERNLATATSLENLDSRVKGNAASILLEKNTRVDQHSAQAKINTELQSETEKNEASIKRTEETFTTRYDAHSLKLETLEAASSEGQGKIENLESVTANLSGVVSTQGSTLTARLNNLKVGGRNLLRNSDFKLGVDNWGTATNSSDKSIFGNLVTVTNTGTSTNYYGLTPVDIFKTINIVKGKEYVLSFYAKGNVPLLNEIWITLGTHLPQKIGVAEIDENLAHRSELVFTADESTDVASIIIGTSGYAKGTWFSVAATKLELGNKATDWTRAPEDTEGRLIEINSSIESFKEAQALENEATATRFDKMDTQYDESFGSINEKYDLVSNELGTTAQALLELESSTGSNSATIEELKETTSTNSGSIASMSTKLTAEYIPKVEHIEANINNAVKKTDVQYYLSTSTTAPEGGEWLTTAPPWTPSMYMFQRIETTYVDGTIVHTPSDKGTNISGAKGDKGLDGVNGINGLEGPKGDRGIQGPRGPAGPEGLRGLTGLEGLQGDQGIPGEKGEDGLSSYTHLAYATSITGDDFDTAWYSTATYIGMYVDSTEEDSEDPTKYNWSLIKGADGNNGIQGPTGEDGKTAYLHIAYATSEDGSEGFSTIVSEGKTYIGQYTDNELEDSGLYTKYKWTLIKGVDGKSSYTHLAYATSSTGANFSTKHFTTATYIGMYVDDEEEDSEVRTDYKWSLIKGADGANGTPGKAGADGRTPYFHVAYANSADGKVGFSTTVSLNKSYIGQYTDYKLEDEEDDKSKYKWTLIKGTDGIDGLDGVDGKDGTNGLNGKNGNFTHIAYSTKANGLPFSPSWFAAATYIGIYVDKLEESSATASKYKWSLIKGANGANGTPGKAGVDGRTPYFHVAYANSADGLQGFSTTVSAGKSYIGQYTDYKLEDEEDDKSLYSWTLIKGETGTSGKGVVSIVEQYAVSTSKKDVPTSWTTTMPEWSYGLYVWTRSAITYTDSPLPKHTQPLVDSSWEAVNNLNVGGRNLLRDSNITVSNKIYGMKSYILSEAPKDGDDIVITIWGTLGSDRTSFTAFNSGGNVQIGALKLVSPGIYRYVGKWVKGTSSDTYLHIYQVANAKTSTSTINAIKLEKGNTGTEWSPAPEDTATAIQGSLDIGNAITNEFGKLKAETKVLTEIGGKVSGWKNLNDGTTSSFDILADNFSIGNSTVSKKPFSIIGNNITFNGKVSFNSMTDTEVIDKAVDDINNLEIGGRNLIVSSSLIKGNYLVESTGNLGAAGTHTATGFIPVNPSSSYIFSELTTGIFQVRFVYYTSAKAMITGKLYAGAQGKSLTAVTPANAAYIRISGEHTAARSNVATWKFEKGNKATDWTPAPEDVEASVKAAQDAAEKYAREQDTALLAQAKTDADNKAKAAEKAAKDFTTAQNALQLVEAKAYADGVVDVEEKARIQQAKDNLAAAKLEAKNKADAALASAKTYAEQEAAKALSDAKLDATDKANKAQSAAETYALAQAEAERVKAESYADGLVTDEEAARIADVNAKLALAKADAKTKADAAQAAAQTYAKTQADQALASAKTDAQTKANKARDAAKDFATAEADAKRIEAQAYADGLVTEEEARAIKDANDKLALAKADATKKADDAKKAAEAYAKAQDVINLNAAKTDAKSKADAAEKAAKDYAAAQNVLKLEEAKAYADGIVDEEEAARIQEAKDNLAAAKADAKSKADAAKKAAESYALQQANTAKTFATTEANRVLGLAKTDATTKANNAKTAAEKYAKAQAEAEKVKAQAYADGIVTAEETARIKDVNAKLATAKTDAKTKADAATKAAKDYADLQVSNIEVGGRNLLKLSDVKVTNSTYSIQRYDLTEKPSEGADFVITLWGTLGTDRTDFRAYNSGGSVSVGSLKKIREGVYQLSGKWKVGSSSNTYLQMYQFTNAKTSSSTINKIQLELGTHGTEWSPSPEDVEANATAKANKALADAKADATAKANAAKTAAQTYATTEAEAKRVLAQAYADGKVSTEEKARIADVNAKLALAKTDATTKADAAKKAAETYAKSQADAALASAKTDATTKANKALADAKTDAQTKANAAKTAAETYAKAQADAAQTAAKAHADGKVTAEEKARIADVNAKLAAAKTDATTKANNAKTAAEKYAKAQADAALAAAKTDATNKSNAAKTHADLKDKVLVIDSRTKKFISPASFTQHTSAVTGYLIIETPIVGSRMVKLNITGYNYQDGKTNIELAVGFYMTTALSRYDYADTGTYPIGNVRLGIKGGKAVVIIGNANSTWSYPKIEVVQAIIGHTNPPDTYKDGWVIRYSTSITDITGVKVINNNTSTSLKSLQDNVYEPGTTFIDGGNIFTDSIKAGSIDVANLSSLSSNLGTITGGSIKIGSNFNVTTAGALTAKSGNFTGVVNATSGSFKGAITASTINIADKFKVDSAGKLTATSGTFSGSITGATGTFSGTVYANKISGKVANIENAAIKTAHIDNLQVSTAKIANLAVNSAKIANLAVTTGKIANLSVDTLQIKDKAVTIPRFIFASAEKAFLNAWINIINIDLDPHGGYSSIQLGFGTIRAAGLTAGNNPSDAEPVTIRILADGAEVRRWTFPANQVATMRGNDSTSKTYRVVSYDNVALVHIDETGTVKNLKVQAYNQRYGGRVSGASLLILGVKR